MRRARLAFDLADGVRRAALAFGIICGWIILAMMLDLSHGVPASELGRAAWLVPWLQRSLPFHLLLLLPACVGFILRRKAALCAALMFGLLWACDMAVRRPHGEHAHQLSLIALFIYAAMTLWGGPGKPAERIAWECCRVVVGLLYTLCGLTKLWHSGLPWLDPRYLETLAATATFQASGWEKALRLLLVEHPWLLSVGGVVTLLIECSGWVMIFRPARPYFLAALVLLAMTTYLGMGITFWYCYLIPVAPLALPLETWFLKASRLIGPRRRTQHGL